MKADLPRREPEIQRFWKEMDIYRRVLDKNRGRPSFILHDGPPYANGDIHLGTALNKILKDIIVKYKSMRGYFCPYVPGWDCHGQPIEHEVEKRLGEDRGKLDVMEVRKRCREYALHFVERQSSQFQRLGVRGDFENPYLTLRPAYEAVNIRVLGELARRGLVYRSRKPIHWCPRCMTALAEAELEYREKTSPSIYVRFPLLDPVPGHEGREAAVVIWTTTPWTLPANVAVALHPEMEYVLLEAGGSVLLVGEPLLEGALRDMGLEEYRELGRLPGKRLEGLKARHPWRERPSLLVVSEFVTTEQGTGAVHIAPGHGEEDYQVGLEYGLPMPMPVDDRGRFTSEAPEFEGLYIDDANPRITADLRKRGLLLGEGELSHPYPHCWRCKGPVIFRATPQWFVGVDREYEGSTLRKRCLEAVEGVKWIPGWNIRRMVGMLESRPDWCISRQRAWGVPIPAFYCLNCGRELMTPETLRKAEELLASEGSDAWFLREAEEILGPGFRCPECGGTEWRKETDILDVWFESGVSHEAVLLQWEDHYWPCDMYLEGSDQHRGWFQTSLLTAVGTRGEPPYRSVLTHGFVVDGEGRKMSKSLGNVISPLEICDRLGADILRLWVAAADYTVDIPASGEIFDRLVEAYRRIRNTLRFLLGNLYDFRPGEDDVPPGEMEELDRWVLSRLQRLVSRCTQAMDSYQLHVLFHSLHNFCAVDLSALYLDMRKDCLYTFAAGSRARRSAQTALYRLLRAITLLMAPVLCHTAEEVWQAMRAEGDPESVQLADWPEVDEGLQDPALEDVFEGLLRLREQVTKAIEEKRGTKELGTSLEAMVRLTLPRSWEEVVEPRKDLLPTLFIVSHVEVRYGSGEEIKVEVERAPGRRCSRCWNYRPSVGSDSAHPEICDRCLPVVKAAEG
ncbi:isoleucine--tRNA ligase [Candidatus Solincola tengchongensis]|uniref:isoleucine--tRNA ligase n=1 Tax=Candidatus Solincola tengchongensis TaxID=2900693 RepID=UPI00257D7667|nr:isoleucine--tRNA ligase [Candidatus Solincola tengchongensis]